MKKEETDEKEPQLSMSEFTPAMAELAQMADAAREVGADSDIALVHDTRIGLRDARINIAKKGKELRDGAIKFQKDVISKEKELIAIIEPEEERLSLIEDEAKLRKTMETRRDELPSRMAALESVGDSVAVSDDELLAMDDDEFNAYRLRRIEAKLEADRQAHEAKVREDEEKAREERAAEDRERREKLEREEAEAAAIRKVESDKIAAERAEIEKEKARLAGMEEQRSKEEAAKRAETDRLEREAALRKEAEKAEADRLAKEAEDHMRAEKYNEFLLSIGYDEKTDTPESVDGVIKIWRLLGTYNPKK